MNVVSAPIGTRGFDCNFPLSSMQCRGAMAKGLRFVVRYVPRVRQAPYDLTLEETQRILSAGLGVMPVQHVEAENWTPSQQKGKDYGLIAAHSAAQAGILPGVNVWLDLEGVHVRTPHEDVIHYCNAWYDQVQMAGFLPGIYVGWQAILTPDELYRRLKFTRYWLAYNLDADLVPAVVGGCMKQHAAKRDDYPDGWNSNRFEIDMDEVTGAAGRYPMVLAPDEWDVSIT